MAQKAKQTHGLEIGEEEALTIMADTLLLLVERGTYSMRLVTEEDEEIMVHMTPMGKPEK